MAVPQREPEEFSAGDTLAFTRSLPDYPAPDWSIVYELTGNNAPRIEFLSSASNSNHSITVDAATTAGWLPGDYVLAGYAVSGAERHRIYYGQIKVYPNVPRAAGNEDTRTFAQKMVEMLEGLLLQGGGLLESRVGDSMFRYQTLEEVRAEHGYWKNVRRNELQHERARSGKRPGNKIRPRFNITMSGPAAGSGQSWPSGYGGW